MTTIKFVCRKCAMELKEEDTFKTGYKNDCAKTANRMRHLNCRGVVDMFQDGIRVKPRKAK